VEVGAFWLAHTRLSIQDLDARSDQPYVRGGVTLTYNGELWNADEVRAELETQGETFTTTGDTEVLAAALDRWGEAALPRLRGMFAVAWTDGEATWLARDRHGEVPVHFRPEPFVFASELKALRVVSGKVGGLWVGPGEVVTNRAGVTTKSRWYEVARRETEGDAVAPVRSALAHGVNDRMVSDVPVCTLLSGGVDSAAITAMLAPAFPGLVAYTAVMDPRGSDLKHARLVADHIGVDLVEVKVEPPTADDLARTVVVIEQPHKAQVEIAWACLALARRIEADGFKVTYSGEGSDELWGSYGFAYHGVRKLGFGPFRRKLVYDQHRKNFARANKVFMRHGVECRLPFLDTGLVETALGLTQEQVVDKRSSKAVLQNAFLDLLPTEITGRPKVAFQDGCGLKTACAVVVAAPRRFYRSEYHRRYGRNV
jgi:asparagine synthase (glutamine-hydrolysing)